MNVGFISLGCSKNLIDTEVAIGKFKEHNFKIVNNPEEADIIVVNTCGFIESAKEEAINTLLEMAEYKNKRCKYLIAMGCLVQRYYNDLLKAMPEVDLFLKLEDYKNMWDKIDGLLNAKKQDSCVKRSELQISYALADQAPNGNDKKDPVPNGNDKKAPVPNGTNGKLVQLPMFAEKEYLARTVSTGENYAYLKIGEGCSNMCTYCAIPYIRGSFISRPMEDILQEANELAKKRNKGINYNCTRYY